MASGFDKKRADAQVISDVAKSVGFDNGTPKLKAAALAQAQERKVGVSIRLRPSLIAQIDAVCESASTDGRVLKRGALIEQALMHYLDNVIE